MKSTTVASLTPAPYNPRKITKARLDLLGKSMKRFGDLSGVVRNLTTGNLIGGHQRVKHFDQAWPIIVTKMDGRGGKIDGIGTVAHGNIRTPFGLWSYREVRWTPAQEKAANLAANAHGGEFDMQLVGSMLQDLKLAGEDLEITGLAMDQVERALGDIVEPEIPAVPAKPITRAGDLLQLGKHLLYCGDSTGLAAYEFLLAGERARMIFTDPPWNVAIGMDSNPKHRQRRGLENDNLPAAEFADFLARATLAMTKYLDGDMYCVMSAKEWPAVDAAMRAAGLHWSATIAWVKDQFVMGRGNYHRRSEPIWYGWQAGKKSSFCGARDQDDVWEIPRPKASAEHPTMKPVELVARALINSSSARDIVLDPFGGAGSLILASEQLGRRGRSIELDPGYCDVIVKRWETMTGKKAKRTRP